MLNHQLSVEWALIDN